MRQSYYTLVIGNCQERGTTGVNRQPDSTNLQLRSMDHETCDLF